MFDYLGILPQTVARAARGRADMENDVGPFVPAIRAMGKQLRLRYLSVFLMLLLR